jgi:hypothetical protein
MPPEYDWLWEYWLRKRPVTYCCTYNISSVSGINATCPDFMQVNYMLPVSHRRAFYSGAVLTIEFIGFDSQLAGFKTV